RFLFSCLFFFFFQAEDGIRDFHVTGVQTCALPILIAALHNVDYEAIGLADFGKPGNYFERQINRWSKQYRASETETIDSMDRLKIGRASCRERVWITARAGALKKKRKSSQKSLMRL